jgi:hypothetical protein
VGGASREGISETPQPMPAMVVATYAVFAPVDADVANLRMKEAIFWNEGVRVSELAEMGGKRKRVKPEMPSAPMSISCDHVLVPAPRSLTRYFN